MVIDPDLENLLPVEFCVPMLVRQAQKGQEEQSLGRGGFSSKRHALSDTLGNPLAVLTGGEITQVAILLNAWQPQYIIAAKGYGSFVETIEQRGTTTVIPPRSNCKQL